MACKVKIAKGGAHLGHDPARGHSGEPSFLGAQAIIISREMKHGMFDYLKHFPEGNKAHLFRREAPRLATAETVRSYYDKWIER